MIDPLSTLSIATAIAQFLDFGAGVLKTAREIKRSKCTVEEVEGLEKDANQLKRLCAAIQPTQASVGETSRPERQDLADVAVRCKNVSLEVVKVLQQFKLPEKFSRRQLFSKAFKIQIKSGEFENCERRLLAAKVDLCLNLTKTLNDSHSKVYGVLERLEERDVEMQVSLASRLGAWRLQVDSAQDQLPGAGKVNNTVHRLEQEVQNARKAQIILSTFRYDAMRARENKVKERHAKTFNWIFSDQCTFSQWLRTESGLYWISGKAGSGKSTLMKYLFECPEVTTQLKDWAGDKKLVISRHFFWNAGTDMQKSYAGLLKSLCYDIFKACPDLIPQVCRNKWNDPRPSQEQEEWREAEMVQLLREVGESGMQNTDCNVRLCFFVDGLDEYHGQYDQLVEAIYTLSKFRNVKVCVSSRPWNVFQEGFVELTQTHRSLALQDLTRDDIADYVRDRLELNKSFVRVSERDPRCSELVTEITTKAEGVFLWVYLVINELLKSLTNDDDFPTLQRRLTQIPPDLEPYFMYMFDQLDKFYQFETAQIFRAVASSAYVLPVLALLVIFPSDPLAVKLLKNLETLPNTAEVSQLEDTLGRRMAGRCGDLLEVKNRDVEFLHRTVKDFLETPKMTAELDAKAGPDLDIDATKCQMAVVSMIRDVQWSATFKLSCLIDFGTHARKLEEQKGQPPQDLHRAIQKILFGGKLQSRLKLDSLTYLASMNLPLGLDQSLKATGKIRDKSKLTHYACEAINYLVQQETRIESSNVSTKELIQLMIHVDPDRLAFRMSIISNLLEYGADPTQLWAWALPQMYEDRHNCSEHRKDMFLKASSEIIRAGARDLEYITDTRGVVQTEERVALETLFGQFEAEGLLSLRRNQTPLSMGQEKDGPGQSDLKRLPSSHARPQRLTLLFSWVKNR